MASAVPPTLGRSLLLGCRAGLLVFLGLYTVCAVFNLRLGYQGNPSGDIALKQEWEQMVDAAKHRGLYLGRWKLLELPTSQGVKVELYDVVADPGETRDVAAEHPDVVARLREQLARERPGSPGSG